MYEYLKDKDKEFLGNMRRVCSDLINKLVQLINSENVMHVKANLIGSGARNLETQNNNEPVDLDYNLVIVETNDVDINDCRTIKEYVRDRFNIVLNNNGWGDCKDSTSALTTEKRHFTNGNQTEFSIDLAIIAVSEDGWYRLIHEKTGFSSLDRYFWNQGKDSKGLDKKVFWIKKNHLWEAVIDTYLEKKNQYLTRNDYNYSSFNCYIEAVNEVYYANK